MPERRRSSRRRREASRLSRNDWLARALELVAKKGGAKLHIETLCRQLHVTRGSFYWHFESRDAFVVALVDYWDAVYTRSVVENLRGAEGSPEEQLLALMHTIHEERLARYDMAVRAWAAQEPAVAAQVARVDEVRLEFVRSLFSAMGFRGRELAMRTRLFVIAHSLDHGLQSSISEAEERKLLSLRHAFFTRR